MKRRHMLALGAATAWLPGAAAASSATRTATDRFALVIGNGAYNTHLLPNTRRDAELMARTLGKAGFTVTLSKDLDRSAMFEAVRDFCAGLRPGATALVYYAGHGIQIDGSNYLLPVDITPTSAAGVAQRAFSLQTLHERLALSQSAVNIIILDACRNNPFQPVPAVRLRSFTNLGLAGTRAPRGTLVAYSTAPGQLAEDGTGRRHSIYTETLANLLGQRGLDAERLFRDLSDQVRRRTLEDQQPWFESSLAGDFYFLPPPGWRAPAWVAPPPDAGRKRANKQYRSGDGSIGSTGDASWYRDMDERAWTEFDHDIERRARQVDAAALPRLKRQAAGGNVVAMTTLAMAALAPAGREQGAGAAQQWLHKAARLDFPVAQTQLAEMMIAGQARGDTNEALRLLRRAAAARYPRARIDLAQLEMQRQPTPEAAQQLFKTILENTGATMRQHYPTPAPLK